MPLKIFEIPIDEKIGEDLFENCFDEKKPEIFQINFFLNKYLDKINFGELSEDENNKEEASFIQYKSLREELKYIDKITVLSSLKFTYTTNEGATKEKITAYFQKEGFNATIHISNISGDHFASILLSPIRNNGN